MTPPPTPPASATESPATEGKEVQPLPCPFCGSEAKHRGNRQESSFVGCTERSCILNDLSWVTIDRWNRRITPLPAANAGESKVAETNRQEDDEIAKPFDTLEEVQACVLRFINSHFRNHGKPHAIATIPADPSRDDDIRLMAHVRRQWSELERLNARLLEIHRKAGEVVNNPPSPIDAFDMLNSELEQLRGVNGELVEIVERLAEWNRKWPKGRIYPARDQGKCESTLSEICEAAESALSRATPPAPPRDKGMAETQGQGEGMVKLPSGEDVARWNTEVCREKGIAGKDDQDYLLGLRLEVLSWLRSRTATGPSDANASQGVQQ